LGGIVDCKNALVAANGDFDKALIFIQKRFGEIARARQGKLTPEGIISCAVNDDETKGAIVELLSETDFIPRLGSFQQLASRIANTYLLVNDTIDSKKRYN